MNSPLCWIGGKSKLAARIIKEMPEHATYAEPFAGAGWVFFRKEPSKFEALNDINSGSWSSFTECCNTTWRNFASNSSGCRAAANGGPTGNAKPRRAD